MTARTYTIGGTQYTAPNLDRLLDGASVDPTFSRQLRRFVHARRDDVRRFNAVVASTNPEQAAVDAHRELDLKFIIADVESETWVSDGTGSRFNKASEWFTAFAPWLGALNTHKASLYEGSNEDIDALSQDLAIMSGHLDRDFVKDPEISMTLGHAWVTNFDTYAVSGPQVLRAAGANVNQLDFTRAGGRLAQTRIDIKTYGDDQNAVQVVKGYAARVASNASPSVPQLETTANVFLSNGGNSQLRSAVSRVSGLQNPPLDAMRAVGTNARDGQEALDAYLDLDTQRRVIGDLPGEGENQVSQLYALLFAETGDGEARQKSLRALGGLNSFVGDALGTLEASVQGAHDAFELRGAAGHLLSLIPEDGSFEPRNYAGLRRWLGSIEEGSASARMLEDEELSGAVAPVRKRLEAMLTNRESQKEITRRRQGRRWWSPLRLMDRARSGWHGWRVGKNAAGVGKESLVARASIDDFRTRQESAYTTQQQAIPGAVVDLQGAITTFADGLKKRADEKIDHVRGKAITLTDELGQLGVSLRDGHLSYLADLRRDMEPLRATVKGSVLEQARDDFAELDGSLREATEQFIEAKNERINLTARENTFREEVRSFKPRGFWKSLYQRIFADVPFFAESRIRKENGKIEREIAREKRAVEARFQEAQDNVNKNNQRMGEFNTRYEPFGFNLDLRRVMENHRKHIISQTGFKLPPLPEPVLARSRAAAQESVPQAV